MRRQIKYLVFASIVLAGGVAGAVTVYDRNLVAHYEFENNGNDSPAVLKGGAQIVEDADRGRVLSLDGKDDYVDCGRDQIFNFDKAVTIACWVKFLTPSGHEDQTIVCRTGQNWRLEREEGSVDFYCNDIRPTESITGRSTVSDRQWHHFAGVYDGQQICVYLDGSTDGCARSSGSINVGGGPVLIGAADAEQGAVERGWRGFIDDMAIFRRALTAEEINKLRNEGLVWFMAGPEFLRLGEIVRQAEAAVKEQNPPQAITFLEKLLAEHETWKQGDPNNAVFDYRRISSDLYFLLAQTKETAGRPKPEVMDAYKRAIEPARFSALSRPRQGPALRWLQANIAPEEYQDLVKPLLRDNTDYMWHVVQTARKMVGEAEADGAIRFLQANVDAYEHWQQQHPYHDVMAEESLPKVFHQLAKAKQAAGSPQKDVAQTFGRVFLPSRFNTVPEQTGALIWLIEHERTSEYTQVIKSLTQAPEVDESTADVVRSVCRDFASRQKQDKFERFLDTVFSVAEYPYVWAMVIESCPDPKTEPWLKKYSEYIDSRSGLKLGRDRAIAARYAAKEKYTEAAELYNDVLGRCGPEDDRETVEFLLCKCLFDASRHREAASRIESFINRNRTTVSNDMIKQSLLMKGRSCLWLGEFDKALDSFVTLIMEYPEAKTMPEVTFAVARCYMLHGDLGTARAALDSVAKDYSDSEYATKARELITRIDKMTQ
jgi:tetratricopeptide (TPR) repeat protein